MRALVGYATKEGHTGIIARRVGEVLANAGHAVDVSDIRDLPRDIALDDYDAIVLGAPVRGGKHLSRMIMFVRRHREDLTRRPSAFFSCSLTSAEHTEDSRHTARELVDALIERTGWHPDHIGVFAGALLYRRYNVILRAIMKVLARRAGGDTDTTRDYDYTRWEDVDAFATEVARDLAARSAARAAGSHA